MSVVSGCEQVKKLMSSELKPIDEIVAPYKKKIEEQAAQIERILWAANEAQEWNWLDDDPAGTIAMYDEIKAALLIPPNQALQDYTDKVLEKAVKLCYEVGSRDTRFEAMDCAEAIKAMKGNPL